MLTTTNITEFLRNLGDVYTRGSHLFSLMYIQSPVRYSEAEFITGFMGGAFNLKVVTVFSLQLAAETEEMLHLLDLSGCPVAHLDVRR